MGNRATTRDLVLTAATSLFLDKGLIAVSMEDVAQGAGCTRRNLYRYYATKEDLAYDVVIGLLSDWNVVQQGLFSRLHGSAAQRLRAFLDALVEHLNGRRSFLRLVGEFDFTFQDQAGYRPEPERADRFRDVLHTTEELLKSLLEDGQADGSLSLPVPMTVLVPTITTVLWSLAQRVALRERLLFEEFGVPGLELVRAQVTLLLRSLTPEGGTHERV